MNKSAAWAPISAAARRATRLRDILQLRFTPLFAALPARTLEAISPANPFKRLLKVLGYTLVRLLGHLFQPIHNREELRGAVWLYVVSQNNVEALRFLQTARPDAVLVAGQGKNIGRYRDEVNRLSLRRKLLYYWQFPGMWWRLQQQAGWTAWRFFDLIFVSIGYYEVYRRALQHYQPRAVVFANDHNDDARALLLACQAEGIQTAYVQHASVSRWFPPLSFNLNLLEGQHALDTYRECGPIPGQVELVGMPKADAYLASRNQAPRVNRVGIAASLLDPTDELTTALAGLLTAFPSLIFTFRAHPSDPRDFPALLATRFPPLLFSDARRESIFDFLVNQDALIAAETSSHLEATLLNVVSLYYRFGPGYELSHDYYGFVRNGLVSEYLTLNALIEQLRNYATIKPADVYRRARYYCATVGTSDEAQSRELALGHFNKWLANQY